MRRMPGSAHGDGMTNTDTTRTATDPKIEVVTRLYDAFFQGDIEAFTAGLADDVDWAAGAASASAPWYGVRRGKAAVQRFAADIAQHVDVVTFDRLSYAANENDVFVAVRWTYTVRATGRSTEMYMVHWFRFADGKIAFFRGCEDTEQSAAAFA